MFVGFWVGDRLVRGLGGRREKVPVDADTEPRCTLFLSELREQLSQYINAVPVRFGMMTFTY